jgi:hypothetical protein
MSDPKQAAKNKDYITQITKGKETTKDTKDKEIDEEWHGSDDEDQEETVKKDKVVIEQGKTGANKPRGLKDLLGDDNTAKPKPRTKRPEGAGDR